MYADRQRGNSCVFLINRQRLNAFHISNITKKQKENISSRSKALPSGIVPFWCWECRESPRPTKSVASTILRCIFRHIFQRTPQVIGARYLSTRTFTLFLAQKKRRDKGLIRSLHYMIDFWAFQSSKSKRYKTYVNSPIFMLRTNPVGSVVGPKTNKSGTGIQTHKFSELFT